MSDASVSAALRSTARLIVVEAPAGCGKTFQGARYAQHIAETIGNGRVLILTHTHAACDVFASRTRGVAGRVDIRTIDSLVAQLAGAYHRALELPSDIWAWARTQEDGYGRLAAKAACLLAASPMIARSLAHRYPVVICDEHQDASADQHAIVMALHTGGAAVRIFGDPMQRIYGSRTKAEIEADNQRWESIKGQANVFDELDEPHRWEKGSGLLGEWILAARSALQSEGKINLRGTLPRGVSIIFAENQSLRPGGYSLARADRKPIDAIVNSAESLLVLAAHNKTVDALRAFFNRRLLIWEGHVREHVSILVGAIREHKGNATSIAQAAVNFLSNVTTGFSPSACGNRLVAEVSGGCAARRRGKPGKLQALGRMILEQPDHKGVANMLHGLRELTETDPVFSDVKIDYYREYWDAVRIGRFDDPDEGLAEMSRRQCYARPLPPARAISTIHKAKGLECSDVLIMPCDRQHFGDSWGARCRLYVAMSRATRSLTFVLSRKNASALIVL